MHMKGTADNRLYTLSFKRWLDLIFVTLVAIIVCVFLHPLFQLIFDFTTQFLTPWPIWLQYSITSLVAGFLWFLLIRLGGFRWHDIGLRRFLRYPPLWFFSLLGLCSYIWLLLEFPLADQHSLMTIYNMRELGIIASAIVVGFLIASLLNKFFSFQMIQQPITYESSDHMGNFQTIIDNTDNLINWIKQEIPIKYPSQDLFGLSVIAMRISRILMIKELRTVGVVGQYGCGKSSLLNLTQYYLDNPREMSTAFIDNRSIDYNADFFHGKLLICRVDGWGRIKGSIAQQILTIAIARLSLEVDCLSVITLPANYREALTGVKIPHGFTLVLLLNPYEDPVKTLERLDFILQATHIRLIIFLEDLDRNTSDEMIRDEMPALLDRLRQLKNISFVLAIGTEHQYSNILIRICDHVESLT
jgi:hypothetical protein